MMSPLKRMSKGDSHLNMKFKVLTDRCASYNKDEIIEVDPNKSRVAIEQTYSALFTMVENGEAEIIDNEIKKTTVGFGEKSKKTVKSTKKSKK